MNWSEILGIPLNDLDLETIESIQAQLPLVDANTLDQNELRKFFNLSCYVITKLSDNVTITTEKAKKFEIKGLNDFR